MSPTTLAIDFGTSNSGIAILEQDTPRILPVEDKEDMLPTAVFFPSNGGDMRIGRAAGSALIGGEEGRYMRALKSILGTSLFHESRLIEGRRRTLSDIVTVFLRRLKVTAEQELGVEIDQVLSGRPVRFHSADDTRNQQAQEDLRNCYLAAGFGKVDFMFEPEAAARAAARNAPEITRGLVIDIGGGTSDFSVFEKTTNGQNILASHGIRLGGTDFDYAISMAHAMPPLGLGGELRRDFGPGLLPVPRSIYAELSTWSKIPFLYTRETLRLVEDMQRHACEPKKMDRLHATLLHQLGHELAFACEQGKIDANSETGEARIDMGMIETGLVAPLGPSVMETDLAPYRAALHTAMQESLELAGVAPDQIDSLVLVGGSSLMSLVQQEASLLCPDANLIREEAFTAVLHGLALATA